MNIVFDLDDSLVNYVDALILFHNSVYGTALVRNDFKSYNFWEVWGGTREEAVVKVESFVASNYYSAITAIEGAQVFVNSIKKTNKLYVVTARAISQESRTIETIEQFFPNAFQGVFLTNKFGAGSAKTKRHLCDELRASIVFEDSAEYANEIYREGRQVFLFNRPWNINKEVHPEIIRVNSFAEVSLKYSF